jgi:hypothetical protein
MCWRLIKVRGLSGISVVYTWYELILIGKEEFLIFWIALHMSLHFQYLLLFWLHFLQMKNIDIIWRITPENDTAIHNGMEISIVHHQQSFLIHIWFDSSDYITCRANFHSFHPRVCVYKLKWKYRFRLHTLLVMYFLNIFPEIYWGNT